ILCGSKQFSPTNRPPGILWVRLSLVRCYPYLGPSRGHAPLSPHGATKGSSLVIVRAALTQPRSGQELPVFLVRIKLCRTGIAHDPQSFGQTQFCHSCRRPRG
ncbi:hypothetical protein GBAR_LOCUS14625, partial [Geodia barretti]